LKETIDYFAAIPVAGDPLAYLGRRQKVLYPIINRKPSVCVKDSLAICKTTESEIRKVSASRCYNRGCCQFFSQEQMLIVTQRYYLKSFEDRREYGIATGGQIHYFNGDRNRKVITFKGLSICITAGYLIHGISKSTYHGYMIKYKVGVVSGKHGNKGVKRPKIGTVQVTRTMKAIIDENTDQMPHQMRGIGHGQMDTLKFLPAGNNWKHVRVEANEVLPLISYHCSNSIGAV